MKEEIYIYIYLVLWANRLLWSFLCRERWLVSIFFSRIALSYGNNIIYPPSLPWPQNPMTSFFKWRCLHIRGAAHRISLQCIASLNTLGKKKMYRQLQIPPPPPSQACLSVYNTLGAFERLVMRFIRAVKMRWASWLLPSQWPGMEGWRRPLLPHKWLSICLLDGLPREVASF